MIALGLGLGLYHSTFQGDGGVAVGFALKADNGQWYDIFSREIAPGTAILRFGQTPVDPGSNEYAVIVNTTDGLKYKFILKYDAVDGIITGGYDESGATGEAETPVLLTASSGRIYELHFRTDEVIEPYLEEVP